MTFLGVPSSSLSADRRAYNVLIVVPSDEAIERPHTERPIRLHLTADGGIRLSGRVQKRAGKTLLRMGKIYTLGSGVKDCAKMTEACEREGGMKKRWVRLNIVQGLRAV